MLENFSFTAGWGYMIRDGKVAELVKDVVLAGNLFSETPRSQSITSPGDFTWNQMGWRVVERAASFPRWPVTEGAPHVRIRGSARRRGRMIDRVLDGAPRQRWDAADRPVGAARSRPRWPSSRAGSRRRAFRRKRD